LPEGCRTGKARHQYAKEDFFQFSHPPVERKVKGGFLTACYLLTRFIAPLSNNQYLGHVNKK
jgi:hypothetical protein